MSAEQEGEKKEWTTRTCRHWLEDGIVRVVLFTGCEQTLADAQENIRSFEALSAGKRYPTVIDYRPMKSMERAARAYYAGPDTARVVKAAALIVASPVSRIIGTFFLGLNKPLIPTRIFNNEEDALAWVRDYVEPPAT